MCSSSSPGRPRCIGRPGPDSTTRRSTRGSPRTSTESGSRRSGTTRGPGSSRRPGWTGPRSSPRRRRIGERGWRPSYWPARLTRAPRPESGRSSSRGEGAGRPSSTIAAGSTAGTGLGAPPARDVPVRSSCPSSGEGHKRGTIPRSTSSVRRAKMSAADSISPRRAMLRQSDRSAQGDRSTPRSIRPKRAVSLALAPMIASSTAAGIVR